MQKSEDLSVAQRLLAERSGRLPTGGGTYPFDDGGAFPGLYEEYGLAPGASQPPMPIVAPYNAWGDQTDIARNASINDPCFYYPPHQYYADTESVWIAFEYHRRL